MDHDQIIRRIVETEEAEEDKLSQQTPLYMPPSSIDASGIDAGKGARCGKCAFFNAAKSECFITIPPKCNAEHGVCGLFVGGKTFLKDVSVPQKLIPKEIAGYIVDEKNVPTHCGNCEYFLADKGACQKVAGKIEAGGCCNGWDAKD